MLINYLFFLELLKLAIPKLRITLLSYIYVNLLIKYTVYHLLVKKRLSAAYEVVMDKKIFDCGLKSKLKC